MLEELKKLAEVAARGRLQRNGERLEYAARRSDAEMYEYRKACPPETVLKLLEIITALEDAHKATLEDEHSAPTYSRVALQRKAELERSLG